MSDLLHPADGMVEHTVTAVGRGRVEVSVSTRFDDEVTVIGMNLSRGETIALAAELIREAARR